MNEDQKLLLTDWFRRARESQYIHYASAEYYSNKHYWLGILNRPDFTRQIFV